MLILIDADPIVYRCGFASETTSWKLVYEDETGTPDEIQFNPSEDRPAGEAMRDWLALNHQVKVLDKSRVVTPDPVSYALRATKVQIESIIAECEEHFKQPGKMLMWISGRGGSYRDKIAVTKPYKGNRDPTHKPVHYDAIREYLRTSYNSYLTSGIEADDAVSIFARTNQARGGESVVICTIDKDLDQIPGHHYNYMNKVFYAITETEAERWFAFQCIAGDATDNICGVWKCGEQCAERILSGIDTAAFGGHSARPAKRAASRAHRRADGVDGHQSSGNPAEQQSARVLAQLVSGGQSGESDPTDPSAVEHLRADAGASGADTGEGAASRVAESTASGLHDSHADSGSRGPDVHGDGQPAIPCSADSGDDQYDQPLGGGVPAAARPGVGAHAPGVHEHAERTEQRHHRRVPLWWPSVVRAYHDSLGRKSCPYAAREAEAVAIEMAQLVKLQEYPGQLWHPHGDLVVPGFGEEDFDG